MKPTENYEQLLARFTKRMSQVESKFPTKNIEESEKLNNQLHYLRGCKETIEYLMTGKLPNDGNHDGMAHHIPATMLKRPPVRHGNLDALDR